MRPSLVSRVAWTTGIFIAASAICVAAGSILMADEFAEEREKRHLTDAAKTLALELQEPDADPHYLAADETWELEHTGIVIAIFEGSTFLAGDRSVPFREPGTCVCSRTTVSCGVPAGRLNVVSARGIDRLDDQHQAMALAAMVAVVVASLLGAIVARRVAHTLVGPLSRLGDAVEGVTDDTLLEPDLGSDEGVQEVDRLRSSMRTTLARLGRALASSRRFSADAAHELRTPLATIIGELSLVEKDLEGEPRDAVRRAHRTSTRLSKLVDRLLVLTTPTSGLDVTEEVHLHDAIEDAIESLPHESWSRIAVAADPCPPVRGDRVLLASMLTNAIENSLKFGTGEVQVRLRAEGSRAVVTILDDGPGIPATERELVFAPFYRRATSRASGVGGHGIGLSLIAHVVAVHHGSVRFVDVPAGSMLEITIPFVA